VVTIVTTRFSTKGFGFCPHSALYFGHRMILTRNNHYVPIKAYTSLSVRWRYIVLCRWYGLNRYTVHGVG